MTDIQETLSIHLEPGETVSHVIALIVVERMEDFEQELRIVTSPHTGGIMVRGAIEQALDDIKTPYYYEADDDE